MLHLVGTKKDLRQAEVVDGIGSAETISSLRSIASCYVCPNDVGYCLPLALLLSLRLLINERLTQYRRLSRRSAWGRCTERYQP